MRSQTEFGNEEDEEDEENAVKRGYVDEAVHWRYSSARNYAGLPGLLEVNTDWR